MEVEKCLMSKCNSPMWCIRYCDNNGQVFTKFWEKYDINKNSVPDKISLSKIIEKKSFHFIDVIEVPCGNCIGCRLRKSEEWATRMMLENMLYKDNNTYFVTLTYNDENLPNNNSLDLNSITTFLDTLRKSQLRLYNNVGIRYYLAGEYGDMSKRPHYHIIIYGLKLNDKDDYFLKYYTRTNYGNLYISKYLEKLWNKGFVVVAKVSWRTCAYVARYVTKKLNGVQADTYKELGIEPEKARMSRMPGIGYEYFKSNYKDIYSVIDENGKMYIKDYIILPEDSKKRHIPKYYDNLLLNHDPELYKEVQKYKIEKLDNLGYLEEAEKRIYNPPAVSKEYFDELKSKNDYISKKLVKVLI